MSTENRGSPEQHRSIARDWIDAFNARDDEREAAARTADYLAHAPDSLDFPPLDDAGWRDFLAAFLEGFPDLHLEIQDTVGDEEMTAQRILFTGTHTGPFQKLPPTGRKVRFYGIEINRMAEGKVAEHWFQMDALQLFDQLGLTVVPSPKLLPRLLAAKVRGVFGGRRGLATPSARGLSSAAAAE